jgi:hypothetical protein
VVGAPRAARQLRNVTGSDPTQFKDAATQVVSPPSYAPGEIVYRFEKAE